MDKKRNVFLFGAGAAISWNGPTTSELTKLIRDSGFDACNGVKITEIIYQTLISNGYSEYDINFETIINVVEELNIFYSNFDNNCETPLKALMNCFLSSKMEEDIFNFSIEGDEPKHGFKLQIPKGETFEFARPANNRETPEQHFLQHLLGILLSNISSRVSKYSYHTSSHSVIDFEQKESIDFGNWMDRLSQKNFLRLYTTNYDRNFKVLLERKGIPVFEGFDCGEYVNSMDGIRADVPRILGDLGSHAHYNIHGSAFWRIKDLDENNLPNPELQLTEIPDLPVNFYPVAVQIEKGRTLLATNIVTGFQKAQRAMITPFRQMQSAFDRDCCFAETIYVIGYSFGDEHINQSINNAFRYNKELKIVIIDPMFVKYKMDRVLYNKLFSYRNLNDVHPTQAEENLYKYFDGSVEVHNITFADFLASQK